jgi:hypothetical protein
MTQRDKKKSGLQKEVSSIFKGVPVPQKRGPEQPSGSLASQLNAKASGKPVSAAPQSPQNQGATLGSPGSKPAGNAPGKPVSAAPPQNPQTPRAPLGSPASKPAGNAPGKPVSATPPQSPQNQQATPGSPAQPVGNTPRKPVSAVHESAESSRVALIQKLNQPAELLRKGAPAKPLNVKPVVKAVGSGRLQRIKDRLFAPKPGGSSARQKASVALIPVLAIVLIFVVRQVFSTSPSKIEGAANDEAPSATAAVSENKVAWEIPAPYPATLRDPMKLGPDAAEKTQTEESETGQAVELIIKGILYSEDNPTAVVGKKIVHVGEKVSGATVIGIDKDSVEFEMDGKRWKQQIPD